MRFEFATATRILFGPGVSSELPSIVAGLGKRAFVITGRSPDRVTPLLSGMQTAGLEPVPWSVAGEPTVEQIVAAEQRARETGCDVVAGIGGGSAIDAGKAVAALLANGGKLTDYLEVIGGGRPLARPSAPFVAVPTTAGTGAEVTRNAVVASPEHRVKVSLRSPLMLPRLALVDPLLTHSMPPGVTASTGLDALTQLVEPFVSGKANPMTDAICREGMRRAARSLRRAHRDSGDAEARQEMALASLLGGLALANAGLGAAHGFAGPIGGMFPGAPHGVICARCLPHTMEANVRALRGREPASPALPRYDEVARLLTGDPGAVAEDGIAWVLKLRAELSVPSLARFGLSADDFSDVVEKAARSSSMRGNPAELTPQELRGILEAEATASS